MIKFCEVELLLHRVRCHKCCIVSGGVIITQREMEYLREME